MDRRRHKFADGPFGDALDDLFESSGQCSLEIGGRVARVCSLLEFGAHMDSAHEMVHAQLDVLQREKALAPIVGRLRSHLLRRKLAPGAFREH